MASCRAPVSRPAASRRGWPSISSMTRQRSVHRGACTRGTTTCESGAAVGEGWWPTTVFKKRNTGTCNDKAEHVSEVEAGGGHQHEPCFSSVTRRLPVHRGVCTCTNHHPQGSSGESSIVIVRQAPGPGQAQGSGQAGPAASVNAPSALGCHLPQSGKLRRA